MEQQFFLKKKKAVNLEKKREGLEGGNGRGEGGNGIIVFSKYKRNS